MIDSRVQLIEIESAVLGVSKRAYTFLPPEYDQADQRFPVLYLLRGHEREWVNPNEDTSRSGRTVIDVYERLRANNTIGPLILVMPSLASDDNALPSMLTDFRAPELAPQVPGIGNGQFQQFFFDEFIPLIDRMYRTRPAARAIAGFSLGGYMAVKAAALRPASFVSVAAFDGSFPYASDAGQAARQSDTLFANPLFDAALGRPRDLAHVEAQNLIVLLQRADRAALRRLRWIIQYGPEEIEPWGSNFYRGEHLRRALASLGISNAAPLAALPYGQHTWQIADRWMEETLPIHWLALSSAFTMLD